MRAGAVLGYRDPFRAAQWLAPLFGCESVSGPAERQYPNAIAMTAGPDVIILSATSEGAMPLNSPRDLGGATAGVYVVVEELDSHYERTLEAGAPIVVELHAQRDGRREYAVRDSEGHLWCFGTHDWLASEGP
jgi:uncharacterized glyoxalase superfamily protein PhnB